MSNTLISKSVNFEMMLTVFMTNFHISFNQLLYTLNPNNYKINFISTSHVFDIGYKTWVLNSYKFDIVAGIAEVISLSFLISTTLLVIFSTATSILGLRDLKKFKSILRTRPHIDNTFNRFNF